MSSDVTVHGSYVQGAQVGGEGRGGVKLIWNQGRTGPGVRKFASVIVTSRCFFKFRLARALVMSAVTVTRTNADFAVPYTYSIIPGRDRGHLNDHEKDYLLYAIIVIFLDKDLCLISLIPIYYKG